MADKGCIHKALIAELVRRIVMEYGGSKETAAMVVADAQENIRLGRDRVKTKKENAHE